MTRAMRKRLKRVPSYIGYVLIICFCFVFIYPFLLILVSSFTENIELQGSGYSLFPDHLSLEGYSYIFRVSDLFLRSLLNSVGIACVSVLLSVSVSLLTAYVLSKKYLPGVKFFTALFLITMFFSGGTIPGYLIIRMIGIYDTYWALILPSVCSTFYIILIRSYFYSLPAALEEAAKIDGANDFQILVSIFLPLSVPIVATISFFVLVDRWNSWMDALLYLRPGDTSKWPIQYVVRQMLDDMQSLMGGNTTSSELIPVLSAQCAGTIIAIAPLVVSFPFLQKFFLRGIMLGSVKG